MDSIDAHVLRVAGEHVAQAPGNVHSVFIVLNGAHGGADVTILSSTGTDAYDYQDHKRVVEVH